MNLTQEKTTKETFEKIKKKWTKIVEIDSSGRFTANLTELIKELTNTKLFGEEFGLGDSTNSEAYSFIRSTRDRNLNIKLLEDVFLVHAFNFHTINLQLTDIRVLFKKKLTSSSKLKVLKSFLKLDLLNMEFTDPGKTSYGINYKIEDKTS